MHYEYNADSSDWGQWEGLFDEEYVITFKDANGRTVRIVKAPYFKKEPELQAGDRTALDSFLGGFASAKK